MVNTKTITIKKKAAPKKSKPETIIIKKSIPKTVIIKKSTRSIPKTVIIKKAAAKKSTPKTITIKKAAAKKSTPKTITIKKAAAKKAVAKKCNSLTPLKSGSCCDKKTKTIKQGKQQMTTRWCE